MLFNERPEGNQGVLALVPGLRAPHREGALGCGDGFFELFVGCDGDVREGLASDGVDDRCRSWRGGRFAINYMGAKGIGMRALAPRREKVKGVDTNNLQVIGKRDEPGVVHVESSSMR